jgi:lysophospholipase L1-like esterase
VLVALLVNGAPAPDNAVAGPCASAQARQEFGGLCRYREENRRLSDSGVRARVIMMGDSITEGWIAADPSVFRRGVIDRGISGQTTAQMLVRFRQDVIDLKPLAVHIMGGTNDILAHPDRITLEEVASNILSMAELARAHGIRAIIGSVLPASREGQPVLAIAELNRRLAALSRAHGFQFVDYYGALSDASGGMDRVNSADGIHPTPAGYERMRPLAVRALAGRR